MEMRHLCDVRETVSALEKEAVRDHGVATRIARAARAATLRALDGDGREGSVSYHRVRSYFWAVVRRIAGRDPAGRDVAGRFVLAAALADLRAVEERPEAAWEQLREDWAGRVPDHVLEEFGRRLCVRV